MSLESRIQYKFRNSLLLAEALTHPSLAYESANPHFDNQRLEYLGDAVLQLIISEELYRMFPDFTEGRLTKLRSTVVSRPALARFATAIHLGTYVLLGKGEESSGGRRRPSTLADAFESLVGAVYLDGGLPAVRDLVLRLFESEIGAMALGPEERNPKGDLQECLQAIRPQAPCYRIIAASGPDHRRVFLTEVSWCGRVLATGRGRSKKDAEARAAQEALRLRVWEKEECVAQKVACVSLVEELCGADDEDLVDHDNLGLTPAVAAISEERTPHSNTKSCQSQKN